MASKELLVIRILMMSILELFGCYHAIFIGTNYLLHFLFVFLVHSDQVRTRVFNMIAEYRRILKNPTPERKKKCIFFDALHRIYQAKDVNAVRAALNYDDDYTFYNDTMDFTMNDETNDGGIVDGGDGDNSGTDNEEIFAYQMSPSQTLNGPNATNGATHTNHFG